MGLIQRSNIGKRALCLGEQPWEVSQLQSRREFPCQFIEGSLSLSCLWTQLRVKLIQMETPCTHKFFCSLINEPWKSHLLLMLWSVLQARVYRCSLCHSAPPWISWRSSWHRYSSGFVSSGFWTKLLLVQRGQASLRGQVNPSELPRQQALHFLPFSDSSQFSSSAVFSQFSNQDKQILARAIYNLSTPTALLCFIHVRWWWI